MASLCDAPCFIRLTSFTDRVEGAFGVAFVQDGQTTTSTPAYISCRLIRVIPQRVEANEPGGRSAAKAQSMRTRACHDQLHRLTRLVIRKTVTLPQYAEPPSQLPFILGSSLRL